MVDLVALQYVLQQCPWDMENRELRSAQRADKAHIAQLQSKLVLLQNQVCAEEWKGEA
ncbi:protein of unknown function [Pseudomonas inefficax]|uniref:Uncharacterized protein n=1 Tax=Pseudomonas inefficax TaxID=2078786 RepID=A0AAQ1PEC5_9PSED|nr:protein of unknown function [Pseudomonas inefficax]